jgi:hypothetical protein
MYSHWLGTTDYLIYLICDYYLKKGDGIITGSGTTDYLIYLICDLPFKRGMGLLIEIIILHT